MMPSLVLDRGSNVSFGLRPLSHLLVVVDVRSVVFWLCKSQCFGGSNVYVQRGPSMPANCRIQVRTFAGYKHVRTW
jgi:hypothetical protein